MGYVKSDLRSVVIGVKVVVEYKLWLRHLDTKLALLYDALYSELQITVPVLRHNERGFLDELPQSLDGSLQLGIALLRVNVRPGLEKALDTISFLARPTRKQR